MAASDRDLSCPDERRCPAADANHLRAPSGLVQERRRRGVQDARMTYLPVGTSACATLGPAVGATPAPCVGTADEIRSIITYQAGSASTASNLLPVATTNGGGDGVLSATTTQTYTAVGDTRTTDGPLPGTADTTPLLRRHAPGDRRHRS